MQQNVIGAKTFWDKPEGTTGKIVIGLGIVLAIAFFTVLAPVIIAMLTNVLYIGILAGIIFLIGCLLANSQFRASMVALFQLTMRQLTGFVVEIDPIGIIKNYLRRLKRNLK